MGGIRLAQAQAQETKPQPKGMVANAETRSPSPSPSPRSTKQARQKTGQRRTVNSAAGTAPLGTGTRPSKTVSGNTRKQQIKTHWRATKKKKNKGGTKKKKKKKKKKS